MKFKTALNHGLVLKTVHRVIKVNQNAWLKPYIDKCIDLRTRAMYDFEEDFFKFMNNGAFGKTMGNVRKQEILNLSQRKMKKLLPEENFHTTKFFT